MSLKKTYFPKLPLKKLTFHLNVFLHFRIVLHQARVRYFSASHPNFQSARHI